MLPGSTELDQHQTPTAGLRRIYTWSRCVHSKGLDNSGKKKEEKRGKKEKNQHDSNKSTIRRSDILGLFQEQGSSVPGRHYITPL